MNPYTDILHLPHHRSLKHPRMALMDRAAQFSPFAALTGYEEAIEETGRLTDQKSEPDEYPVAVLDQKYRQLSTLEERHPQITVTSFVPDDRKSGGAYERITGKLKKVDPYTQSLTLLNGKIIFFQNIIGLESDIFVEE